MLVNPLLPRGHLSFLCLPLPHLPLPTSIPEGAVVLEHGSGHHAQGAIMELLAGSTPHLLVVPGTEVGRELGMSSFK